MTLQELLELCKTKNWTKLLEFQSSNVSDLSTKLLVSAVITAHHPDKDIVSQHGLMVWSKHLSADPVSAGLAMMSGAVDLVDFAGAYFHARSKDLDDEPTARVIAKFVKVNKNQLGQYLNSKQIPEQLKDFLPKLFGDMAISKKDKEDFFKKTWAKRDKEQIAFIQAEEKAKIEFSRISDLRQSDFVMHFSWPSNLRGIQTFSSQEGEISFKESVSNETIQEIEKKLNNLGIPASFYTLPRRGIQLLNTPQEFVAMLTKEKVIPMALEQPDSLDDKEVKMLPIPPAPETLKKIKSLRPEDEQTDIDIYQYSNTVMMRVAFGYACKKGSLNVVKYFVEKQHMPGDIQINLPQKDQQLLALDESLKGSPLRLAVQSGNINLVKYIYDNTEATVETTVGQDTEPTVLMEAVQAGNLEIVKYLLEHTADLNAHALDLFNNSPVMIAIKNHNTPILSMLIAAGAMVTNKIVRYAIEENIDIAVIEQLMICSINHEDPYDSYLLAAIKSGNIALLQALEKNPFVKTFEEITPFYKDPIEKRMLSAAARSGSVIMMDHLVIKKHCDLPKWLNKEYQRFDEYKEYKSLAEIQERNETIFYLTCSHSKKNVFPLLHYLFVSQSTEPPSSFIERFCASTDINNITTAAFLHRYLTKDSAEQKMLLAIAQNLDGIYLNELFEMYNSKFIFEGNFYKNTIHNFRSVIENHIKLRMKSFNLHELWQIVKKNIVVETGALFYFSTEPFNDHPETLLFLLRELQSQDKLFKTVDIQNYNGDTLLKFVISQNAFNIAKLLLQRGADVDVPNAKGETALNIMIEASYRWEKYQWVQNFIAHPKGLSFAVQHSLVYESKREFSGYHGLNVLLKLTEGKIGNISLKELWSHCLEGYNSHSKVEAFLTHLSTEYAEEMLNLVKDETFSVKAKKCPLETYFSRVQGFDLDRLKEPELTHHRKRKESEYEKNKSVLFQAPQLDSDSGVSLGVKKIKV